MATKVIEKILNSSYAVIEHDVEYDIEKDMFTIDLDIEAPRDNQDWNNLMKIRTKIRSEVHASYKLNFILRFTT